MQKLSKMIGKLHQLNSLERTIATVNANGRYSIFRRLSTHTSTIDRNEVSHFKNYSSTWWDEMGEMKPLHSMNKLRVPFIRDGLINSKVAKEEYVETPHPLKSLKLLDVGCGGGLLTEPLARLGCNVMGIDVTPELVEMARQHASQNYLSNLTYMVTSVEEHADKNKEVYDAVVASEVIEHVNDKSRFVYECVRCLKPGGSIFFTTVNKTLLSQIGVVFVSECLLKFIPAGTHDYNKFLEPHILQRFLEDNGCRTRIVHGMFYNYFTNNWMWMENTSICYALHAVKL